MEITEIRDNKEAYMPLLLLADEEEDMVLRHLEKGTLYVLSDGGVRALCVVLEVGEGVLEIKNIATSPESQKRGYGRALISFLEEKYKGRYRILRVGTGDSPLTIPFYEKCGFQRSFSVKNFFTDNYDHPIFECGKQLIDMIYLEKTL